LPYTEDAKESDITIFDLSGITHAAIIHKLESYKHACVFSARFKKRTFGSLARLAWWHRDNTQKQTIVEDLEKGLDTKPKEKTSCLKVGINAIREGMNLEGVHEIIKSLTILQGKCSICTLNERINTHTKLQHLKKIMSS
jgi:hypothetical protein